MARLLIGAALLCQLSVCQGYTHSSGFVVEECTRTELLAEFSRPAVGDVHFSVACLPAGHIQSHRPFPVSIPHGFVAKAIQSCENARLQYAWRRPAILGATPRKIPTEEEAFPRI